MQDAKLKRILDDYKMVTRRLESMQKRARNLENDNEQLAEELRMLSEHMSEFTQQVI